MRRAIIRAWQQYYIRKKAFLEVVGKILPEIGVSRRILIRNRSNGPQSPRELVAFMSFHVSPASRLFFFLFLFLFWNNPTFGYSAFVRRSLSWLIKNAAPRSHMHSSSKQAPAERAGKTVEVARENQNILHWCFSFPVVSSLPFWSLVT